VYIQHIHCIVEGHCPKVVTIKWNYEKVVQVGCTNIHHSLIALMSIAAIGACVVLDAVALKWFISVEHNSRVGRNPPGLRVEVTHHYMKCDRVLLQNKSECVDMTLKHVEEGVGRELCRVMLPHTPFMECSIELVFQVSTKIQIAWLVTLALTPVATSATIEIGT
jgi:hypothetical protein